MAGGELTLSGVKVFWLRALRVLDMTAYWIAGAKCNKQLSYGHVRLPAPVSRVISVSMMIIIIPPHLHPFSKLLETADLTLWRCCDH